LESSRSALLVDLDNDSDQEVFVKQDNAGAQDIEDGIGVSTNGIVVVGIAAAVRP